MSAVASNGFQQVGMGRVCGLGAAGIVDQPAEVGRGAIDKGTIRLYAEAGTDDLLEQPRGCAYPGVVLQQALADARAGFDDAVCADVGRSANAGTVTNGAAVADHHRPLDLDALPVGTHVTAGAHARLHFLARQRVTAIARVQQQPVGVPVVGQ